MGRFGKWVIATNNPGQKEGGWMRCEDKPDICLHEKVAKKIVRFN